MKKTSLGAACELEAEEEATGDLQQPGLGDLVLAWPGAEEPSASAAASPFDLAPAASALGLKSLAQGIGFQMVMLWGQWWRSLMQ